MGENCNQNISIVYIKDLSNMFMNRTGQCLNFKNLKKKAVLWYVFKEESADIDTLQTQLPLHCCELSVPALLQGQGLQYGYP